LRNSFVRFVPFTYTECGLSIDYVYVDMHDDVLDILLGMS